MQIKTGYLYHIKDEFFEKYNNHNLMQNHELGRARPTYFTIKDKDILWFIPLSTKIEKYNKIINSKIKKYGLCKTIIIRNIAGKKQAILIQNAFPTLEKYIDHIHTYNGVHVKAVEAVKDEILENFKYVMKLKQKGKNLFFVDIDNLKQELLNEELVKN